MIDPQSLGALANLHELLDQLVQDLPPAEVNRRFAPELPSMGWLLGRSVYLELHWLREKLLVDEDLARRVRHIFAGTEHPTPEQERLLPPRDHLLNWAMEIQDHHLSLLANPGRLPDHPWLRNGWIVDYLVQVHGQIYERMLSVRQARAVARGGGYQVAEPLQAALPAPDTLEIPQGHYRIGAREGVVFDNEQPMQLVELRNFRIMRRPVDNAAWLAFMEAGGYREPSFWSEEGWSWKGEAVSPRHWRRDDAGHWYAIGLNGPMPLLADQPVSGISWYEAEAFANWLSSGVEGFQGAILPHEYHWEAAARIGGMEEIGRVWEWCANPPAPYADYEQPVDPEMISHFDDQARVLRGGCLHTQPRLRRPSLRHWGPPTSPWLFSGLRLVLPPALEEEALYREQWRHFLN